MIRSVNSLRPVQQLKSVLDNATSWCQRPRISLSLLHNVINRLLRVTGIVWFVVSYLCKRGEPNMEMGYRRHLVLLLLIIICWMNIGERNENVGCGKMKWRETQHTLLSFAFTILFVNAHYCFGRYVIFGLNIISDIIEYPPYWNIWATICMPKSSTI